MELLADASLPAGGPGRASNGNLVLSELRVTAAPAADMPAAGAQAANAAASKPVALKGGLADYSQPDWNVTAAIDGDPKTGWAVSDQFGKSHVAIFETSEDVGTAAGTTLTLTLDQQYGQAHTIGRLRLSATTSKRPLTLDELPDPIRPILAVAPDARSEQQKVELAKFYRSIDSEYNRLSGLVAATQAAQGESRLRARRTWPGRC